MNFHLEKSALRKQYIEAENERNQLKQALGDIKANSREEAQKNQITIQLKRAQQAGEIQGFIGRLGDLGAIHAEFDVAITTCCYQLNHFVVQVVVLFSNERRWRTLNVASTT